MFVEQTQEVEDALAARDFATAREEALDLQDRVTAAIEAGNVPRSLRSELLSSVRHLIELIPNPPAPDEEEDQEEKGKDENGKGKGKGKGSGKGNDEEAETSTDDATTLAETGTGADG